MVVIPEGVTAVFTSQDGQDGSDDEHAHEGNSGWIGAALLAGFILMCVYLSSPSVPSFLCLRASFLCFPFVSTLISLSLAGT